MSVLKVAKERFYIKRYMIWLGRFILTETHLQIENCVPFLLLWGICLWMNIVDSEQIQGHRFPKMRPRAAVSASNKSCLIGEY